MEGVKECYLGVRSELGALFAISTACHLLRVAETLHTWPDWVFNGRFT